MPNAALRFVAIRYGMREQFAPECVNAITQTSDRLRGPRFIAAAAIVASVPSGSASRGET